MEVKTKAFFVYLLVSCDKKSTYVGASVDVDHRLRQHNGELAGGARATKTKLPLGKWERVLYVSNFPTWQAALQFEWRWKQITRKTKTGGKKTTPVVRRLIALHTLLGLTQSTSKAVPYEEWENPPLIHYEASCNDGEAELFYITLHD
jgi:predicted GIY-YIG superfamily endonuclease